MQKEEGGFETRPIEQLDFQPLIEISFDDDKEEAPVKEIISEPAETGDLLHSQKDSGAQDSTAPWKGTEQEIATPAKSRKPEKKETADAPFMQHEFRTSDEVDFQKKKKYLIIAAAVVVVLVVVIIFLLSGNDESVNAPPPTTVTQAAESKQDEPKETTGEETLQPGTEEGIATDASTTGADIPKDTGTDTPVSKAVETEKSTPKETAPVKIETKKEVKKESVKPVREKQLPPTTEKPKREPVVQPPKEDPAAAEEAQKQKELEAQRLKDAEEAQKKADALKAAEAKIPTIVEGQILSLAEIDSPPQPITQSEVEIPSRLMRSIKFTQMIFVQYLINHKGDVEQVKFVKRCSSEKINKLVKKIISGWKFTPPDKGGVKVKVWKTFTRNLRK
ncbi:MAG: hypothetical protein GY765_21110 [bacterium]|nr:hypothetical protein [bacterium]